MHCGILSYTSIIFDVAINVQLFFFKFTAESLAAPKIGAVLRFRDKWQKCPDLAPIFTIWGGKIGAPLWTDFKWQKCHNLAFIFTIWGGKIGALLWIDFMWLKCPDLAPIFQFEGGKLEYHYECEDLYFKKKEDFYCLLLSWLSVSRFCPDLSWFRRLSRFLFQLTKDSASSSLDNIVAHVKWPDHP